MTDEMSEAVDNMLGMLDDARSEAERFASVGDPRLAPPAAITYHAAQRGVEVTDAKGNVLQAADVEVSPTYRVVQDMNGDFDREIVGTSSSSWSESARGGSIQRSVDGELAATERGGIENGELPSMPGLPLSHAGAVFFVSRYEDALRVLREGEVTTEENGALVSAKVGSCPVGGGQCTFASFARVHLPNENSFLPGGTAGGLEEEELVYDTESRMVLYYSDFFAGQLLTEFIIDGLEYLDEAFTLPPLTSVAS